MFEFEEEERKIELFNSTQWKSRLQWWSSMIDGKGRLYGLGGIKYKKKMNELKAKVFNGGEWEDFKFK